MVLASERLSTERVPATADSNAESRSRGNEKPHRRDGAFHEMDFEMVHLPYGFRSGAGRLQPEAWPLGAWAAPASHVRADAEEAWAALV